MPWKIIKLDKKSIIAENEDIRYKLNSIGFKIDYKNNIIKKTILKRFPSFKKSRKRINENELNFLYNGINMGFISMDSFRWLNTWVVTKGDTYRKGKNIANKISRKLLGLDNTNIDRWAGKEMGQLYEFTNNQIFLKLSKKIKNRGLISASSKK